MKEYTEGNKLVMEVEKKDLINILEDMNFVDENRDYSPNHQFKSNRRVRSKIYRYLVLSKLQEMEEAELNINVQGEQK